MKLKQIYFANRYITSINGMPFYCSSGKNSRNKGTWFPFFGVLPQEIVPVAPRGWFIKPNHDSHIPPNIREMLSTVTDEQGGSISIRFGTLPCMLISSILKGGFWETTQGQRLQIYLEKEYADFYHNWRSLTLESREIRFSLGEIEGVNEWLAKEGKVKTFSELKRFYIVNLKDYPLPSEGINKSNSKPKTPETIIENCKNAQELLQAMNQILFDPENFFTSNQT